MTYRVKLLVLSLFAVSLTACGSDKAGSSTSQNSVAASTSCFSTSHVGSCHQASLTPGTGKPVVSEWQQSIHFRNNVAGCIDCHETDSNHYCSTCHGGGGIPPVKNPDAAGKCGKCHGLDHPADRMVAKAPSHFANVSSNALNRYLNYGNASYVSGQYVGKCRQCHGPHDPSSDFPYNQKWAESGMGDPRATARTGSSRRGSLNLFGTDVPATKAFFYANPSFQGANATEQYNEAVKAYQQFGNSNTLLVRNTATSPYYMATFTPGCVRCHTTTGFVNFVDSGFMSLKAFGEGDPSKEVTGCDACHVNSAGTSYGFQLRPVPAVTIYYNFSSTYGTASKPLVGTVKLQAQDGTGTTFTDFGASNMCVPCHSGRGRGAVINLLAAKADAAGINLYANTSIPGTHDFAAAGILDRKIGYEFPGNVYSEDAKHDTILMSGAGKSGPCVGCHMLTSGAPENSHLFMSVAHGAKFTPLSTTTNSSNNWTYNVSTGTPISNTVEDVVSTVCSRCHNTAPRTGTLLNTQKQGYLAALTALKACVTLAPIASGDYTKIGTDSAAYRKTMGASFNASYLGNEPGAYVHSPLYTKQIIYDSIDHLRIAASISQPTVYDTIRWLTTKTNASGKQYMTKKAVDDAVKWLFGSGNYSTRPTDETRPH